MNRGGHPGAMGPGQGAGRGRMGRMGHPMGQGGGDEPELDEPAIR